MINLWLVFLAILGFSISFYISSKKGHEEKIKCIVGEKCDVVLKSKYNKTFGFRNEILGMLYYVFIIALVLIFLSGTKYVFDVNLELALVILGSFAFLFSVYLTYIQFFVLKATCDYCLTSAAINLLILIIELI